MAIEDAQAVRAAVDQFRLTLSGPGRQILLIDWAEPEKFRATVFDTPDELLVALSPPDVAPALASYVDSIRSEFSRYVLGAEALVLIVDSLTRCDGGAAFAGVLRYPLGSLCRPASPPPSYDSAPRSDRSGPLSPSTSI